ncbi:MAG: hypothetical protein WCR42_01135 [bacterium]
MKTSLIIILVSLLSICCSAQSQNKLSGYFLREVFFFPTSTTLILDCSADIVTVEKFNHFYTDSYICKSIDTLHYTAEKDTTLTGKLYTIVNKNNHIYIIAKDKSFKKSKKMESIPKTRVDEIRESSNHYTNRSKQVINNPQE